MAEEEKKEVVAAEQPQGGMTEQSKSALTAFILSMVGFLMSFAWLFAIAGIVLGAIALGKGKRNDPETQQQPFKTFGRIAKPVAIVDIVLGAIMFVVYLVVLIVTVVGAIAAAAA